MKKIISLILVVLILALSLCACGVSLTDAQKECRDNADELFSSLAADLDLKFDSKLSKKDGKILYIATLDFDGDLTDSNARTFQQYLMPAAEKILGREDMYVVLYLEESGKEEYRIIDSKLDPSILD